MNTEIIYLKPTKFRERIEMVNHLLPGLILLLDGLSRLSGENEPSVFSPFLNILAGGGIIGAIVYELRHANQNMNKRVAWIDIFAGIVLLTEGMNIHHRGKIFQPGLLYMLIGTVVALKGTFSVKIPRIRRVIFDEHGFMARTSPFRKIHLTWNALASMKLHGSKIQFTTATGQHYLLYLRKYENRNEVYEKFKEEAVKHPVTIESP